MATIDIKKARQVIRLDDSEGSPEYTLDLTDKGIGRKIDSIRRHYAKYTQLKEKMDAADAKRDGEAVDALMHQLAEVYEQIVSEMLGAEAYRDVVGYVGGGEVEPWEMNAVLTPLVMYLLEQVNDAVTANKNEAIMKYVKGRNAADAL